jgi:Flp pilus assembly protein TadD
LFYAESWALVHYLSLGNQGKRQPQLLNFLKLLMSGTATDAAFQQAFQTDAATLEKELREYIQHGSFTPQQYYAREQFEFADELSADKLSEAEWQYYLGNLAVHLGYVNGEPYLEKAIALESSLAAAHAALGVAKMRAGKSAEAKRHLQNALELNAQNAFVPYYYALALFEEAVGEQKKVSDIPEMTAVAMRGQLKRAIALDANFTEAYRLLAFVYLVRNENLDEAVTLLTRARTLQPGRAELGILLGQIYLRQNKYAEAQQALEPLAQNAADPAQREQAAALLAAVKRAAEQTARYALPTAPKAEAVSTKTFTPRPALRKRFDGEKAEGKLIKMSCDKGLTIFVETAQKTWEFHAANPDRVQFVTLAQNAEEPINCGTLSPAPRVVVTYRYNTDAQARNDGELIAVEFVNR